MSKFSQDYHEFNNPIKNLGADTSKLTGPAKDLVEGDLIALAWGNSTTRLEKLGVRDVQSIVDAFAAHPFSGDAKSQLVGAACCCTCTPACCCTAGAVRESTALNAKAA